MDFQVCQQNKMMVRQLLLIKYYFIIIIMATKSGKNNQMMNFRTTRRSKKLLPECQQPKENARCISSQESIDHLNQISPLNQQQPKPKLDKQTTTHTNSDVLLNINANQNVRRNTRSSANLITKINIEVDRQQQQYTPDDNNIHKIEEPPTSKKINKVRSSAQLSQEFAQDKTLTLKKIISKPSQTIASPYNQFRKSYRKQHKKQIVSLPYRKCHDILEGRIVTIINKIESGKNCLRDFQSLIQKMHKISSKDLMNRFIVAGIKTIISIAHQKNIYDPKIILKLQEQSKNLQQRIFEELDSINEYQGEHEVKIKSDSNMNRGLYRSMYMKKMYSILRKKMPAVCSKEAKQKIVDQCEKLFQGEINLSFLVRCLKNKLQL